MNFHIWLCLSFNMRILLIWEISRSQFFVNLYKWTLKLSFLNRNLKEDCMDQLVGFIEEGKEHMVCKLKKSIYGLKQTSMQWYLKFNDTIMSFGFKENVIDKKYIS